MQTLVEIWFLLCYSAFGFCILCDTVFVLRGLSSLYSIVQVCVSNPALRDYLKDHVDISPLNKLKWEYFAINKSPW